MSTRPVVIGLVLVLFPAFARGQVAADAISSTSASAGIRNIGIFLQQCPDRDPAYLLVKQDFEIRRDGNLALEPVCTEPISAIPTAQYTDELIVSQGLRVMYYMDRGQSGHLPWTGGTLYDWMRSKVGGINIVTGLSGGNCCTVIGGRRFINMGSQNDFNRDFDRSLSGIAGNIDFYAHEARHVDGFPHSSCCGIPGGCDDTFDPANLSAYGVQWWLNSLWLAGTINVGYECLSANEVSQTTDWFQSGLNSQFRTRFCTNLPPLVSAPAVPGGPCPTGPRRRAVRS